MDNKPTSSLKSPFSSLEESLEAVLQCLNLVVPFRLWMINRGKGSDGVILSITDQMGQMQAGSFFCWDDSLCGRMLREEGPKFAHDAQAIPSYAAAPINEAVHVGAYIGQPLVDGKGELLGALCGIDAQTHAPFTPEQQFFIETQAKLMSTLIAGWLTVEEERRKVAQLRYQAEIDRLTGLANRHLWESVLKDEDEALSKVGENALVVMVDLDGLKAANDNFGHAEGDRYLVKTAEVLRENLRDADVIARLGGDEFAVFIRGAARECGEHIHQRLQRAFDEAGVKASIGYASRISCGSLEAALQHADAQMYKDKSKRKGVRYKAAT